MAFYIENYLHSFDSLYRHPQLLSILPSFWLCKYIECDDLIHIIIKSSNIFMGHHMFKGNYMPLTFGCRFNYMNEANIIPFYLVVPT